MKLQIVLDYCVQVGDADGVKSHQFRAGETVEVADEGLASVLLSQGAAQPVKAEKATRARGEKAVKE
ncbi:MAG TPA: hypothetical protein DCM51_05110 [Actinobacteria bacterium]|nr:hypothetical protein [Actinomycetota bacterium]